MDVKAARQRAREVGIDEHKVDALLKAFGEAQAVRILENVITSKSAGKTLRRVKAAAAAQKQSDDFWDFGDIALHRRQRFP